MSDINSSFDKISGVIVNTIISNLGCTSSANTLTNAQLINIQCNPPAEWGDLVYNTPTCKKSKNKCTDCYACCLQNVDQNSYIQISTSCGVSDDLVRLIQSKIKSELSNMYNTSLFPSSINNLMNTINKEGITKSITNVQSVQNINIVGVGIQQRIHQNIVANIFLNTLRTQAYTDALNTFISDMSKSTVYQPSNLRMNIIPPNTAIEGISNIYTNALLNSLQSTGNCIQNVQLSQNSTINCNTPEMISKALTMATSPACIYAKQNGLDTSTFCTLCSISNVSQNMVVKFTANCTITAPTSDAQNAIKTYLMTPGNSMGSNPITTELCANPSYVDIVNKIASTFDQTFTNNIYQSIVASQNVIVTDGGHVEGITQNSIYDLVLTAVLNAGKLDDILTPPAKSDPPQAPPPAPNNGNSLMTFVVILFAIVLAFFIYMSVTKKT